MNSAVSKRRQVLSLFGLQVCVLVIGSAALIVVGQLHSAAGARNHKKIDAYHLPSISAIGEALRGVDEVRLNRLEREHARPERWMTLDRHLDLALHSVGRAVGSVATLQERHGSRRFTRTASRAASQAHALRDAHSADREPIAEPALLLQAVDLTLRQLDRLHANEVESLLARNEELAEARELKFLAAMLLVGVVILGLSLRLWALLRARLHDQEEAERAMLEKERELQQSHKMRALGTLVGGVAHDFNNLLTAILGYAHTLGEQPGRSPKTETCVRGILAASEQASMLTRQLLAFSRREPVEPKVLSLGQLIFDLQAILERLLPSDIELSVDCSSEPVRVEIDPVQIQVVMINLVVNARDSMPDGGRLRVRVDRFDPAGVNETTGKARFARITVRDEGCGMDEDTLARVFEPFFTTKERGRGTGLGLAMVHGILEDAGGQVTIESTPGLGTTVELLLPECLAAQTDETSDSASVAPTPPISRGTILVAEDEPLVRDLLESGLSGAGYEVLTAVDGIDALRLAQARAEPADLVLTDVMMPGLRGDVLATKLQELWPDTPIVFMSGYCDLETEDGSVLDSGQLVAKPFRIQQILAIAGEHVGGRAAAAATG